MVSARLVVLLPTGFPVTLCHLWCCCLVSFGEEWSTSITKSQRSRARIPSMRKPASREIISASVVLCETEVCFLHIQLNGTKVRLPKMHRIPPEVDLSLQGLLQNRSLEIILICIVVLHFPHDNIVWIHSCERSNALSVCHKLLTISWPHDQVCSKTIKYRIYRYEPRKDIFHNLWANCGQFSNWSNFFFFLLTGGHPCMALRLCVIVELFYSPVRNIFPRISLHDLTCMSQDHEETDSASGFSLCPLFLVIFNSPSRSPWYEHILVIIHNIFANLAFSLSATQINMVKQWCWFSQINVFQENLPSRFYVCSLACQFDIVHIHR